MIIQNINETIKHYVLLLDVKLPSSISSHLNNPNISKGNIDINALIIMITQTFIILKSDRGDNGK